MKKFLSLFLAFLLAFSLTACNTNVEDEADDGSDKKSSKNKLSRYPLYEEKVDEYTEAATVGYNTYQELYGYTHESINQIALGNYYFTDNKRFAYALEDLDDNKVPELIFGNLDLKEVYDIYTIHDDTLVKLFENASFGDRSRLHVLSGGRLLTEGSNSAFSSSADVYYLLLEHELVATDSFYFDTNEHDTSSSYMTKVDMDEYSEKLDELLEQSIFDELDWIVFVNPEETEEENSSSGKKYHYVCYYAEYTVDENTSGKIYAPSEEIIFEHIDQEGATLDGGIQKIEKTTSENMGESFSDSETGYSYYLVK